MKRPATAAAGAPSNRRAGGTAERRRQRGVLPPPSNDAPAATTDGAGVYRSVRRDPTTRSALQELRTATAPILEALPEAAWAALGLLRAVTTGVTRDPRGELVALRDGWGPLAPATLKRWARDGRLRAFEAERSKLVAWEADIRAAVEHAPYDPPSAVSTSGDDGDRALLSDPTVEGLRE